MGLVFSNQLKSFNSENKIKTFSHKRKWSLFTNGPSLYVREKGTKPRTKERDKKEWCTKTSEMCGDI